MMLSSPSVQRKKKGIVESQESAMFVGGSSEKPLASWHNAEPLSFLSTSTTTKRRRRRAHGFNLPQRNKTRASLLKRSSEVEREFCTERLLTSATSNKTIWDL